MPQMGVSVSEGTITKWLKSAGETVAADEPLLEISTDKVDTEVPSPAGGVLQEILVEEGATVEVGTKVATIAPEGAAPTAQAETPPQPATQPAADASMAAASEGVGDVAPAESSPQPSTDAQGANGDADGRAFISPVVARIASEHGIDAAQVPGTGRGGRVTKKDILAFVESGGSTAAPA